MSSTPNYILKRRFVFEIGAQDMIILDPGTFVRPLDIYYVPKHIKERHPLLNLEKEVYCYGSFGIIPIPRDFLREV